MKSVLRSIKPYWFYLICEDKKLTEVGKTAPTAEYWDKITYLYCSKDMKSFNLIPKEHREKYRKYLGKVGARFICDKVEEYNTSLLDGEDRLKKATCLDDVEIMDYMNNYTDRKFYGWHISELKIYDKPKELGEFRTIKCTNKRGSCSGCKIKPDCLKQITRPPQSWQYVEELI